MLSMVCVCVRARECVRATRHELLSVPASSCSWDNSFLGKCLMMQLTGFGMMFGTALSSQLHALSDAKPT